MTQPFPITDEVWLVTGVNRCIVHREPGEHATFFRKSNRGGTSEITDLILQGFHAPTKELLHTYGPFTPDELLDFAALHGITLPTA